MSIRALSRPQRGQLLVIALDACIVLGAYYVALNFRYAADSSTLSPLTPELATFGIMAVVVHVTINWLTGIYSIVSSYMSLAQAVRLTEAGVLAVALLFIIVVLWPLLVGGPAYLVPRTVVVAGGTTAVVFMVGVRFVRRIYHETVARPESPRQQLLLVGAGQAADMLLREIKRTPSLSISVVGLVDDRRELQNMSIQGYPVLGYVADAPGIVDRCAVTQIVVAIPSASGEEIASIYRRCKPAAVPIKILPSLAELVSGTVSLHDARDLDVRDLLGRPAVETDIGAITDCIQGQTVLVTGGGGSIGAELCTQIARLGPSRLVVVDHDESSLYELHERLQNMNFSRYSLYPASVLQARKVEKLFAVHRPCLVFHAAAYKHVPLMELSPDEAVLNNVKGTYLVAETAARYGVERFVNISTDKAVEPRNVMGATKRAGELIVGMLANRYPHTLFASVRFGNVLGSQGSVIPVFKSQIKGGGPLTITHPAMTRYFMLIEEAVQLLLQAAILMEKHPSDYGRPLTTFVLDMGNPISIVDLAQRMIDFYWNDKSGSLGVEFSGLRPGEKLDERLTYPFEETEATAHPLVKRVRSTIGAPSENGDGNHFNDLVSELISLAERRPHPHEIIAALTACVPEYRPQERPSLEKSTLVV